MLQGILIALVIWINICLSCGTLSAQTASDQPIAPPILKARIEQMRKVIASNSLHFSVGYTSALTRSLDSILGAKPPRKLYDHIVDQHKIGQTMLKLDSEERQHFIVSSENFPSYTNNCKADAKTFDWREFAGVTPVCDQKCGNCWAYAASAAYESSYLIRNSLVVSLSKQYLLDCAIGTDGKSAGDCSGGWHGSVFDYLIAHGDATDASDEDQGYKKACDSSIPTLYRAVAWDYVQTPNPSAGFEDSMPNISDIKVALCEHGALAAALWVTETFQAYTNGVYKEFISPADLIGIDTNNNNLQFHAVNHDVVIIGWDDEKQAWLIKNSWGTNWGDACGRGAERGYMWIDYHTANIGLGAAWVTAASTSYQPSSNIFHIMAGVQPFPHLPLSRDSFKSK